MGKIRSSWNTRGKKRKEKDSNPLKSLLRILYHFFSEMQMWIEKMQDPRNRSYITYTQTELIFLGLMKNFCSVESMRGMSDNFNEESCIENLGKAVGNESLKEIPHYDTLNNYLERLSPEELSDIRTKMVKNLLRSHDFDNSRINGTFWRVILDGTGLFYFKERHCENCLKCEYKNADGSTTIRYFHKILEAKIVLAENIVISLDTEFIENENENVTKQDCEIKAAKRLLARLKSTFPRLNICIQGDALYAAEPVMELCQQYGWKYLLTHKENRQPMIDEVYNELEDEDKTKVDGIGAEKGTGYFYNKVGVLAGKKPLINICEYRFSTQNEEGKVSEHRMLWLTNINLTKGNLGNIINAGRGRWKIENEGFNTQKNILYKIQHLNSRNKNAMKNHYLLTQLADIIMQLYLAWDNAHSTVKKGIRNMAAWILESFRKDRITEADIAWINKRTAIYLE